MINTVRIKQVKGSLDCVGCVAAMATGTSIEQFKEIMGNEGPWSDWHFSAYCMLHNAVVGVGCRWNKTEINPEKNTLGVEIDLTVFPAYLVVDSETGKGPDGHAVYWNTIAVLDPNPDAPDNRPLSDYKISNIFPISFLDQDGNITYAIMRKVIAEKLKRER